MLERQNDRVGWHKRKQDVRNNMPERYHNGFEGGRGKHKNDDTKVRNGF